MNTDQGFDFSTHGIPDSWLDAAGHAPRGDGKPLEKPAPMRAVPPGHSVDVFTASLAALVVCLIGGYLWHAIEVDNTTTYPWVSVVFGIALAVTVRLTGGTPDPQVRAAIALTFYIGGVAGVTFLTARSNFMTLYGSEPGLIDFEQELLRSRLTSPWAAVAWVLGAFCAVQVSYLLRHR